MNKLNSKTTRIVSALALSAGLFSVSNSAMAASCSMETALFWKSCTTGDTAFVEGKHKMTATANATDKITGLGVRGYLLVMYNGDGVAVRKDFVGSTKFTSVTIDNRRYFARVFKYKNDGRVTKLKGSVTANLTP